MVKRIFWIAILLGLLDCLPAALAQNKTPESVNVRPQPPAWLKLSLQGELQLTLRDAITLALERNPVLIVEKIHLEQARLKVQAEKGNYDPLLNLRNISSHRDNVVASRFYPTGLYAESERASTLGIEYKTYSGGRINLGSEYRRLESTSNTQTLSPQYSANVAMTFSQSFLRDFGRDVNTTRIRIAQKGEEIADRNLFQKISELVQQVETAYWNFAFLRDNIAEKQRSLNTARELLRQNEQLFTAGRIAQVNVLQARAAVASREEDLLTADNQARKFEDRLKVLLWLELSGPPLAAVDKPDTTTVAYDMEKSLRNALMQRPEAQGLQKELEQREIEAKFAANQTLPRLDLTAQYGVSGLSGQPSLTCLDPTATICLPVGGGVSSTVFANQTGASDALTSMFAHKPYANWSVDLKLQIPLGNRTAQAQLKDANLKLLDTRTRLRSLRDQFEMELRDGIRETETAKKRIDAAREAVRFTEDQLAGTRSRLEAGLASSYDVFQALDELDKAKGTELRAVMDFNVGQSKVRFVEASNLQTYAIDMGPPPPYVFEPDTFENRYPITQGKGR